MLDIHIADSYDAATRSTPVIRIDLKVHADFFNEPISFVNDCPHLHRMRDHFADYTFSGPDLQGLLEEIDGISQRIIATSLHQTWLKQLREACQTAMANGESIYVLSD